MCIRDRSLHARSFGEVSSSSHGFRPARALFARQPRAVCRHRLGAEILQSHRLFVPVRVRRANVGIAPAPYLVRRGGGRRGRGGGDAGDEFVPPARGYEIFRPSGRPRDVAVDESQRAELRDASNGHRARPRARARDARENAAVRMDAAGATADASASEQQDRRGVGLGVRDLLRGPGAITRVPAVRPPLRLRGLRGEDRKAVPALPRARARPHRRRREA
mgnify:CR=1 FL=1